MKPLIVSLNFLYFVWGPTLGMAATPIYIDESFTSSSIGHSLEYWVDDSKTMNLEDVSGGADVSWQPVNKKAENFGYRDGAIWLRFSLVNKSQKNVFFLDLGPF